MSDDYNQSLAIGYFIGYDEIREKFTVHYEKKSHTENRFNPKTGERISDVEVIDQEEGDSTQFEGEELDKEDLVEAIAEHCGCSFTLDGEYGDDMGVVFGPNFEEEIEFSTKLRGVEKLLPECKRIRKKLVDLGLKPDLEPRIYALQLVTY